MVQKEKETMFDFVCFTFSEYIININKSEVMLAGKYIDFIFNIASYIT